MRICHLLFLEESGLTGLVACEIDTLLSTEVPSLSAVCLVALCRWHSSLHSSTTYTYKINRIKICEHKMHYCDINFIKYHTILHCLWYEEKKKKKSWGGWGGLGMRNVRAIYRKLAISLPYSKSEAMKSRIWNETKSVD